MPEPFSEEWYAIEKRERDDTKEKGRREAYDEVYPELNTLREQLNKIKYALGLKQVMRWGYFGPYYDYPDGIEEVLEAIKQLKEGAKP